MSKELHNTISNPAGTYWENIVDNNAITASLSNNDCIYAMKDIEAKSVDLILTDLPYGVSRNQWDNIIPLEEMWAAFHHVLKPKGAIVLSATQPFSSMLVMSNLKMFKYEWIWEKTIASNQLNVAHQPLRSHESVLVFGRGRLTYNEPITEGEPYSITRKINNVKNNGYGLQKGSSKINDGFRHAKSILKVSNPRIKNGHTTQKPLELMEKLIKIYSNEGDIVLDCCMGSGTTGVAALLLGRKFIGIEIDEKQYILAMNRIKDSWTENNIIKITNK